MTTVLPALNLLKESLSSAPSSRLRGREISSPGIAFLYLTLPNLPLLLSFSALAATPHGYINFEYLLIGAAALCLPRGVQFILLIAESLADFAYTVCYTYQFSPETLFSSARYLFELPARRLLEGFALTPVVFAVCATLVLVKPHPRNRLKTAALLLSCAALLFGIDILGGCNPLWHRVDLGYLPVRLTRSPVLTLGLRELESHRGGAKPGPDGSQHLMSASSNVVALLNRQTESTRPPNVVLIWWSHGVFH